MEISFNMKKEEATYWIALAHMPRWGYLKINNLIIKFFHENKISIEEFFQLDENDWKNLYQLDERQVSDLKQAKSELASNAFANFSACSTFKPSSRNLEPVAAR